jgi:hypothetical protein
MELALTTPQNNLTLLLHSQVCDRILTFSCQLKSITDGVKDFNISDPIGMINFKLARSALVLPLCFEVAPKSHG